MTGALAAISRRPALAVEGPAAGVIVTAIIVAGTLAGCSAAGPPAAGPALVQPSRAAASRPAAPSVRPTSRPARSHGDAAGTIAVPAIGRDPASIARQLTAAERVIGEGGAPAAVLTRQALTVQLACLRLTAHPGWAASVMSEVAPAWRTAAAADIAATADLVALTPPEPRLPPWRIIKAQNLDSLRADYRAAQAATGVGWSYLAAINFVETDFGRIAGPSSAGAQGPMQFLPATWASYGRGDIHLPRPAILAAARFLRAHGATGHIGPALFAYNPSWTYVDAVLRYARRIRSDPHALTGYYQRQIIFHLASGWVLLPAGYGTRPAIRAIGLRR